MRPDYDNPHSGEVIFDSLELDMSLTQAQLDLVITALEFLYDPNYFKPPYRSATLSCWKITHASKIHIDDFGNRINRGEDYLSTRERMPMRISYQSVCGLWNILYVMGWHNIIKKKLVEKLVAIDKDMCLTAEIIASTK